MPPLLTLVCALTLFACVAASTRLPSGTPPPAAARLTSAFESGPWPPEELAGVDDPFLLLSFRIS